MPTFIFYSCPRCSSRMETQDAYQSVGSPFLVCDKCNSIFSIAKNRTEWDLKRPFQRGLFFAKVGFFSLLLGAGTGVLLSLVAKDFLAWTIPHWFTMPVGVVVWYWLLGSDLRRNIRESRARMADPGHRRILQELGLLELPK